MDGLEFVSINDDSLIPYLHALFVRYLSEAVSFTPWTYRIFYNRQRNVSWLAVDPSPSPAAAAATPDLVLPSGALVVGGICAAEALDGQMVAPDDAYIGGIAVLESYRGCGLARRLYSKCVEVLVEAGCHGAVIDTEMENTTAIRFYESQGFVRVRRLDGWYAGCTAMRMKVRFSATSD